MATQGMIAFDDDDRDDETYGVMDNPNAGQGSSPMHGKDSPVANLISNNHKEQERNEYCETWP